MDGTRRIQDAFDLAGRVALITGGAGQAHGVDALGLVADITQPATVTAALRRTLGAERVALNGHGLRAFRSRCGTAILRWG